MAAKCYFTGKKARRQCPGVKEGVSVPVSSHACAQKMIYEVSCPSECLYLVANHSFLFEKIIRRINARIKQEPLLLELTKNLESTELFFEIERILHAFIWDQSIQTDEEIGNIIQQLKNQSRAKKVGLIFSSSGYTLSRHGPVVNRLNMLLCFYRSSGNYSPGDSADEGQFYKRLLYGRHELLRKRKTNKKPYEMPFPSIVEELMEDTDVDPGIEEQIVDVLDHIQHTLDHHIKSSGYIKYLKEFY